MMTFKHGRTAMAALLGVAALHSGAARAVDLGGITINGYGDQTYIRTKANKYNGADTTGKFPPATLALVLSANLGPKTKLFAQLTTKDGEAIGADYVFADYAFNDDLNLRAGKVLAPVGFYNEIIDAKFLQKSAIAPLLYQLDVDIVDEAYTGAGVIWSRALGGGKVTFDAYGGQIVEHAASAAANKQRSLAGGRIDWRTPVEGLRFMVSAANKAQQEKATGINFSKKSVILGAEYRTGPWDVKAEFANVDTTGFGPTQKTRASYLQVGYDIGDDWTPFARVDRMRTADYNAANAATYQDSLVGGITYRINSGLSVRLEHHVNKGYAMPALTGDTPAGTGKERWGMSVASVNFIF